jgi:hypothetical protein
MGSERRTGLKSEYPEKEPETTIPKYVPCIGHQAKVKLETRVPKFWIADVDGAQYFVNDSDEVLDYVDGGKAGWATSDDDVLTYQADKPGYYKNVKPGEAVKIDDYDENDMGNIIFGSDFMMFMHVEFKSPDLGVVALQTRASKGSVYKGPLMWEDGTLAKGVNQVKVTGVNQ